MDYFVNPVRAVGVFPHIISAEVRDERKQVQRTQQLLGEAQRIAYDVQNVQQVFNGRYKAADSEGSRPRIPK